MPRTRVSLGMIVATIAAVTAFFLMPFTPRTAVRTVTVKQGDLLRTLKLEGTVGYRRQQVCAALNPGVVEKVYVHPGQRVQQGELLFAMDVSAQVEMLTRLSSSRYAQEQAAEWLAAFQGNGSAEWELRTQIEGAKIRAQRDGVIRAVYVEEGDAVAEAGLLGVVSGEEKCVAALAYTQELQGVETGAAAVLITQNNRSAATLCHFGAPEWGNGAAQSTQQLTFLPLQQETLADVNIGERVEAELLVERMEGVTLIPLGAVDKHGQIWLVEEGKARPQAIDTSRRNEGYVAADSALSGARLILQPDEYSLWAGCPVKEARTR